MYHVAHEYVVATTFMVLFSPFLIKLASQYIYFLKPLQVNCCDIKQKYKQPQLNFGMILYEVKNLRLYLNNLEFFRFYIKKNILVLKNVKGKYYEVKFNL